MSSVVVCIRIRPFNDRERKKGCKCAVSVVDNQIVIQVAP